MPKVLDERGCRVYIYTNEHDPPHVHIEVGDGTVAFDLDEGVSVRKQLNIKASELRKAREVVQDNLVFLLQKWAEIHRS